MIINARKSPKNWIRANLGLNLGRAWGGLKPFRAALGRILAVLGAFKMYLFSDMGPRWVPKGFLAGSSLNFGKVWGAFGEGFAGIWNLSARLGAYLGGLARLLSHLCPYIPTRNGTTTPRTRHGRIYETI